MAGLGSANREIMAALIESRRRGVLEARSRRAICVIDDVIDRLEALYVAGRYRAPLAMDAELRGLAVAAPPELSPFLHSGVAIPRVIDALFEVQGNLLRTSSLRLIGEIDDPEEPDPPGSNGRRRAKRAA